MSEEDIRDERLKKLQLLRDAGMEAYPVHSNVDSTVADFLKSFDDLEKRADVRVIAGRVMSVRGQGGIMFADIFDGSGSGQLVFQTTDYDNVNRVFKGLNDNGDALPTGTYYYRMDFSSGAAGKTGFISLRK